MKLLCFTILIVLVLSASAQQEANVGEILGGFMNTVSSNMKNNAAEQKGDCLSVAFDLITFLYGELQSILKSGKVPDQMYMMMQGMVAFNKFTAAKSACFPEAS